MNKEENESFKIFEPLPDYTLPQIETIRNSETRKQTFTETYSYFTNPLHIITETDIQNLSNSSIEKNSSVTQCLQKPTTGTQSGPKYPTLPITQDLRIGDFKIER